MKVTTIKIFAHGAATRRRLAALLLLALMLTLAHRVGGLGPSFDMTSGKRHAIPVEATMALTQLLETGQGDQELTLEALLTPDHPLNGRVRSLHERYRRHAPGLTLEIQDPRADPEALRTGRAREAEVRLRQGERSARLNTLDDAGMLGALLSLSRPADPFVLVTVGAGNRRSTRGANHDLSETARALEARGLTVLEFDPGRGGPLPANIGLLIVASPRLPPDAAAMAALRGYIDAGGQLMVLQDPSDADWIDALELPVKAAVGTVVDPASQFRNIDDPAFVVVDQPPPHPALAGFDLPVLFVHATALVARPEGGSPTDWETMPLFETNAQAWCERQPIAGQVSFDPDQDLPGPLRLGVALERPAPGDPGRRQRMILIGDGDWLSNAYLGNGGNLALAERLVEWLLTPAFVAPPVDVDANFPHLALRAQHPAAYLLAAVFLFVLPLGLLLAAVRIWQGRHA